MAVGAPVHQGYEDPQDQAGLVEGEASEGLCEATLQCGPSSAQELARRLHQTCGLEAHYMLGVIGVSGGDFVGVSKGPGRAGVLASSLRI